MKGIEIIALLSLLFASSSDAAPHRWRLQLGLASVDADGESRLVRPNGKVVRTDLDEALGVRLHAEYRRWERLGLGFGYLGSSHEIEIRQDFPDGTDFSATDGFGFDAVTAGLVIHLTPGRRTDIYFEAFLAYVRFDDVVLESAGPPFDIESPLDLVIEDKPGFGAAIGLEVPIGDQGWSFHTDARVLATSFEGTTRPDSLDPGFSSSLDLDFNALIVSLGFGYRF